MKYVIIVVSWFVLVAGIPALMHWPWGAHAGFLYNALLWLAVAGATLMGMAKQRNGTGTLGLVLLVGSPLAMAALWLLSSVPLRAGDYHQLAGGAAPTEATLDTLKRPEQLVRVSTRDMAWQMANKALGGEITLDGRTVQLTSQFEIVAEKGTLLRLDDKEHQGLYWIFVLDYSGLFAALDLPWVPGYVLLSATDPQARAELVTDRKFRYSPNAFWDRSVDFQVYWRHLGEKVEETHLELDQAGKAWWITAYSKPAVGVDNYVLSSVSLLDPETGAETSFSWEQWLAQADQYPWLDRVVPEVIAARRLDQWWALGGGWLNSLGFPGVNVLQRTPYSGNELWFLPLEKRSVWLSGITSMNNQDYSLVNFSVIDTRTGQLNFVKVKGTEEDGAVKMAQGALGADSSIWRPVLPTPVVFEGKPWWSLMIVDSQNLFRAVALLPLDSTNEVYFGNSLADAMAKAGVGGGSQGLDQPATEDTVTLTLTVQEAAVLKQVLQRLNAATENK
jgi:hypothetical protein